MRILYFIPHLHTVGADHWIYRGWKEAYGDLGHEFFELTADDGWRERVAATRPDVFFSTNFIDLPAHADDLCWIRAQGVRVLLNVDWPMWPQDVEIITTQSVADAFFGEREPESMQEFEAVTGRKYHLIPNAASRTTHFPTRTAAKYSYDIVFLGAKLHKKRRMFDEILEPLRRRYKVGVFGPYWSIRDQVLRAAQKLGYRFGLSTLGDAFNRARVSIPEQDERLLYSSAKISLNFHEREPDGSQPHYIVNQRAFKIPACGGFQICDHVPALRKYFAEDELVMATDPRDWFDKVAFYLEHDDERRAIAGRGATRAQRDHTYHNRVVDVLRLAGMEA